LPVGVFAADLGGLLARGPNHDALLLLGVKLEGEIRTLQCGENLKVPGIGFAEWCPGNTA
jgi:hypothetical protein